MTLDDLLPVAVLDPWQLSNARTIMREFLLAGYPTGVAIAAVANSWGESQLGKFNYGDNGQSIGLFQLASFGAGKGMSVEERLDPVTNTRRIIQEVRDYGQKELLPAAAGGATVAYLIHLFARDIERPANVSEATTQRVNWARKAFPGLVDMAATSLPNPYLLLPSLMPWWAYAIGGLGAVALTAGLVLYFTEGDEEEE